MSLTLPGEARRLVSMTAGTASRNATDGARCATTQGSKEEEGNRADLVRTICEKYLEKQKQKKKKQAK
jgi:hypothetical protein